MIMDVISLVLAAGALWLAWRANTHSNEANRFAEEAKNAAAEANRIADRAVRVQKLPTVEKLYEEFADLRKRLREPDRDALVQLGELAEKARLISVDSLYPPLRSLRSTATRIWQDSDKRLSEPSRSADEERRKQELPTRINAVGKSFEDFINR